MTDLEQMLKRQTQWQKSRQSLTWPEKIRMAERVRDSVRQLRVQPRPFHAAHGGKSYARAGH